MYLKDKPVRITLRLTEAQFAYVKSNSDILGVTPSEFLRMVVNASMAMSDKTSKVVDKIAAKVNEALEEEKGLVEGRENDKTSSDNLV